MGTPPLARGTPNAVVRGAKASPAKKSVNMVAAPSRQLFVPQIIAGSGSPNPWCVSAAPVASRFPIWHGGKEGGATLGTKQKLKLELGTKCIGWDI